MTPKHWPNLGFDFDHAYFRVESPVTKGARLVRIQLHRRYWHRINQLHRHLEYPILKFSNSDVIAFAAAVIALCSLGATIWQGWIARSHNRRSVRPIFGWLRKTTTGQSGTILCFSARNVGIGPGIVKAQSFTVAGRKFDPIEGGDYVRDVVAEALGPSIPYVLREHGLLGVDSAIPPGGHWIIAEIEFVGMNKQQVDELEKQINVEFTLHYECIYGGRHILQA